MKILKKLLIVLMIFGISGCASIKHYTAYTIYPIGYLLNRIGGDRVNTYSIQNNGPVETATPIDNLEEVLADSIYLFHINELEPYLEVYDEEIEESGVKEVDLSLLNSIYKFQRYTRVASGNSETYIESSYYDDDSFEDIDTLEDDLYLWLDPSGMLSMAKDVYDTLSSNYVEQSAFFKTNYDSLYKDLTSLEASFQTLSTTLKKENKVVKFVSMTPAFGSWQKSYGFSVYPVCLSKYGTLPTDKQLEVIKEKIIEDDVRYIAYEPNMSEDMKELYRQLLNDESLNLKSIELNNISSLTTEQINSGVDYLTLMYKNLEILNGISVTVKTTVEETE